MYLCDVNFLLLFADGSVLLLSNSEANGITEKIWQAQRSGAKLPVEGPTLMQFFFLHASRTYKPFMYPCPSFAWWWWFTGEILIDSWGT